MTTPPDIRLPSGLVPHDGRFGSGPSRVRAEAIAALRDCATTYMGTSHRREPVKRVVRRIREGLAALYSLPDGYEVMLGVGGATAFWDAATFCLVTAKSQHAVFGEFSAKFAAVVSGAPHLMAPDIIASELGTHPELAARNDIDAYALTHNETTTGVAMPVVRPDDTDAVVLVDATSAAGAIVVDPAQFDVYYFSPQKAFGSDGGLWVAIVSPRALMRIEQLTHGDRWIPPFLDLGAALSNSRKDQTVNTPALATLALLADQVDWMLESGGLTWAAARCDASSSHLYRWAEASPFARPFVTAASDRSPTVATIDFHDAVPAGTVAGVLRSNGIVDTESYRKLGRNQLRIACFPNTPTEDVALLTEAIDYIVERL